MVKNCGKAIQAAMFLGMLGGVVMMFSGTDAAGMGFLLILLCLVGYGFGRFVMMLGS